MARKKLDPNSAAASVFVTSTFIAGAFAALLLTVFFPMLRPYGRWLQVGSAILSGMLGYQWLRRTSALPDWFFGALPWAAAGNVVFFVSLLLQEVLGIWLDLTPYQMAIDLVSLACPVLLGAIGALKHKDDYFEEDHNNG